MDKIRIAVDGPAGAGKSTIAKSIAKKLNILHLDTGAMYRAIGLYALQNGIDAQDETKVTNMLDDIEIEVKYQDEKQQTILNGKDVSGSIRTPDVSNAASAVSKWPAVRNLLVKIQQQIADSMSVVMDGRDIGTHVMPEAEQKFYLTASVKQRAKRRYLELKENGQSAELEKVEDEIAKRDYQDSNREFAPLRKADDAIEIDTTKLGIDEVINIVYERLSIK